MDITKKLQALLEVVRKLSVEQFDSLQPLGPQDARGHLRRQILTLCHLEDFEVSLILDILILPLGVKHIDVFGPAIGWDVQFSVDVFPVLLENGILRAVFVEILLLHIRLDSIAEIIPLFLVLFEVF